MIKQLKSSERNYFYDAFLYEYQASEGWLQALRADEHKTSDTFIKREKRFVQSYGVFKVKEISEN